MQVNNSNSMSNFKGKILTNPKNTPKAVQEKWLTIKMAIEPKSYDVHILSDGKNKLSYLYTTTGKRLKSYEYTLKNSSENIVSEFCEGMKVFEEQLLKPTQKIKRNIENFVYKHILKI